MRTITVIAPDPSWTLQFQQEKRHLQKILKDIVVSIDHIGSTSIPYLWAKPVIDILISVSNINKVDSFNSPMKTLGYIAHGEFKIPGRRFFTKDNNEIRTHHIHIFQEGDPHLKRHLNFRDYMIAHPEEAKEYAQLKITLAQQYPNDIDSYCGGKDSFIKATDVKAGDWDKQRFLEKK